MRYLVSAMLLVVAVMHLLPASGVVSASRLSSLYGVSLDEPNLSILMRDRAVLFGLLGALLALSALPPALALMAGFVTVPSFLYLAWSVGDYNPQVGRVFTPDLLALVCLVVGAAAYALMVLEANLKAIPRK